MNPRDPNSKEKVGALNSLQELMGTILYDAWLSEKFPNVPTQKMREKTAEETAAMMTLAEIKAQEALFQRIQFHKAEVQAYVEKLNSSEKEYAKKQAEFIEGLNQANQDDLKRIMTQLQSLEQIHQKNDLLESIKMIDKRITSLTLERNHLNAAIQRLGEIVEVYDNKIRQRMEVHIDDARFIANLIPDNHPQANENRQLILDATEQYKNKQLSSSEYFKRVTDAAKPYAANIPVIAVRLNRFEETIKKTILIEEKRESLVNTQEKMIQRLKEIDKEIKLEEDLKSNLSQKLTQITEVSPSDERKNPKSSTGQIGFLLANKNEPEIASSPAIDFKEIIEKVEALNISTNENELNDELTADLSAFDLDLDEINEIPEILPIKSYEQSVEDKPYDPDKEAKSPSPAYESEEFNQGEEKQPDDVSQDHFRPGR